MTRAAVWKAIKALQQEGYPIEAVTHRGYRLTGPADILSAMEIEDALKKAETASLIQKIYFEKSVGSTNQEAKRAAENGAPDGSLFVAECQQAGRGRRGRTWISDHQQGLWFSLLLRPQASAADLSKITLFAGLCAAEAVNRLTGIETGIKWPNDLVDKTSGRKIGGILTEMIIEENLVSAVIIGIGLNINTAAFPDEIASSATSLRLASGQSFRRTDVLASIIQALAKRYPDFLDSHWLDDYRRLCLTLGRQVRVTDASGYAFDGVAVDLDQDGELIIEDQTGNRRTVLSGEVSVRGLLGYS